MKKKFWIILLTTFAVLVISAVVGIVLIQNNKSYTISHTISKNGGSVFVNDIAISNSTLLQYKQRDNVALRFQADEGYHIANVSIDGENVIVASDKKTEGTYSFDKIVADHKIEVVFEKDLHVFVQSVGKNGTAQNCFNDFAYVGENVEVSIQSQIDTIAEYFQVSKISINGESYSANELICGMVEGYLLSVEDEGRSLLSIENIKKDLDITVYFSFNVEFVTESVTVSRCNIDDMSKFFELFSSDTYGSGLVDAYITNAQYAPQGKTFVGWTYFYFEYVSDGEGNVSRKQIGNSVNISETTFQEFCKAFEDKNSSLYNIRIKAVYV